MGSRIGGTVNIQGEEKARIEPPPPPPQEYFGKRWNDQKGSNRVVESVQWKRKNSKRQKVGGVVEEALLIWSLGFDGLTLGTPTPRRPLDYQSCISGKSSRVIRGWETAGAALPSSFFIRRSINISRLQTQSPLCATVSPLNLAPNLQDRSTCIQNVSSFFWVSLGLPQVLGRREKHNFTTPCN